MSNNVRLSVKDVKTLVNWLFRNNVSDVSLVHIEETHTSGIGPSVYAKVWTESKEGIMLNLTDIDSW